MAKAKVRLPSFGTVLGFTALVVAVVGTASATPSRTIVRKGDIAKGAVTAKALASGAVHAKALAQGSVTAKAVGKAAIGPQAIGSDAVSRSAIAPSSIYGGSLGSVAVHKLPLVDSDTPPELSGWTPSNIAVAKCDPGERLISGGVVFTDPGNGRVGIIQSAPAEDGWVGQITSDSNGTAKAEVQVVCLK
jgi:hypothetical protein